MSFPQLGVLQKGVISWLANLEEDFDQYHKIFSQIDNDNNGYILSKELKQAIDSEAQQLGKSLDETELGKIF